MNTQENNKLIAEFMGFQKTNIGWYDSEEIMPPLSNTYDSNTFDEHELAFHKSWDWLMPVVEKIEDIECKETSTELIGYHLYDVEIRQNVTTIHRTNIEETLGDKLFNTYNAVVEFINQYNK